MRHGRAGRAATDAGRPLTAAGREEVRRVAAEMRRRGATGLRVAASPLARARETAEILAGELEGVALEVVPRLASGAGAEDLLAFVESRMDRGPTALVGHMPEIGVLGWWLATGARGKALDLAAGAVVAFEVERVRPDVVARVEWMLAPAEAGAGRSTSP